MDDQRAGGQSSRRGFLAAAGASVAAAVAGCAEPGADPGGYPGRSSRNVDYGERADGTAYTDVYEQVMDSVALLHVTGMGDEDAGQQTEGQGSAFVYDDGYLVTNEHVVWEGDGIGVQYANGDWASGELVGSDVYSDLAVLEVDHLPGDAEPLSFTEVLPTVGQEVLAVGNPLGFEGSMSTGVVSGVNRSLPGPAGYDVPNVVQTDAAVNPGNSGGPLMDVDGSVVGVINAGVAETIGFAISSALARRVLPSLVADGEYQHAQLGITYEPIDPAVASANDLEEARGVLVVDTPGPADGVLQGSDDVVDQGGSQIPVGGDVVVELAGRPTPDRHALSKTMALETSPGEEVDVVVLRDGTETTVELTLGARPVDPERPY